SHPHRYCTTDTCLRERLSPPGRLETYHCRDPDRGYPRSSSDRYPSAWVAPSPASGTMDAPRQTSCLPTRPHSRTLPTSYCHSGTESPLARPHSRPAVADSPPKTDCLTHHRGHSRSPNCSAGLSPPLRPLRPAKIQN